MHRHAQNVLLLTCALVISGCATNSPAPSAPLLVCPTLPPAPASVMQPVQADFGQSMRNFLFNSQTEQTR